MTENNIRSVRRIVTGLNTEGRSCIVFDGPSPHAMSLPGVPNFGVTDIWRTEQTPANNTGRADACRGPIVLAPPRNGSVFRVVEFPPDQDYVGRWRADEAFASMGESGSEAIEQGSTRHEGMHTTDSVDYAFVLDGEIWAVLDDSEVRMAAGDVLVQRGTRHAWSNRSNRPCLVGFVLIDAQPAAQ